MKKIITFGEVLLRLAPKNKLRFEQADSFNAVYGGSELNVALSLSRLGKNTSFVTRLPENRLSEAAILEMHKYGIDTSSIVRGGDRLGLYFIEMGAGLRSSNVVYDRQFSAMAAIKPGDIDWDTIFKEASWFHWSGITAGISESAAQVCLEACEVAQKMGVTISTDFNYRANLWKYGKSPEVMMEPIVSLCDVVLAGDYASEQYFNIKVDATKDKDLHLCKKLQERFSNLKHIAITHRKSISASHNEWSAILFNEGNLIKSKTYSITDIVDRIGAGDSFMAGLIYGLTTYNDDKKALDFAVLASALKHTISGDANLMTASEIENLLQNGITGLVSR